MRKFIIGKHKSKKVLRRGTKARQSYKRTWEKVDKCAMFLFPPYAVWLGFY